MRKTPRVLVSGAVTGLLALGLVGSPAEAYTRSEKKAEKRQNSAIKKTSRAVKKTDRSVRSLRNSTKQTDDALGKLAGIAAQENAKNSATIAAVVPAVTTALTQLRDGLTAAGAGLGQLRTGLEAAGAGLTQLRTGLETVGTNLTRLGENVQAVEYGAVRLYAGAAGSTGNDNLQGVQAVSANSGDIPDDSNGALVTATVPFPAQGATRLTLRSAIRSNEADGNETGDPAGQVAGIFFAKCIDPNGCAADRVPTGAVACTPAGPPPPNTDFPEGSPFRGQPVVTVQRKAPRAGFANPTANDTNPTGGDCTLPGAGLYELTFNVQFFDFPTSTTPGPRD